MNPWKGLKDLPKESWIIAFAILINRMGTMVLPFLVIYLTSSLQLKAGSAGFVVTFYGLGSLLTAPFVGRLADKIGSLLLMKLSLFLTGFVLLLYPYFKSYESVLMITFLWAVISEAFRPASLSLTSELVRPEIRKTAFALNRLMINLGMSIGPVLAGFLIYYSFSLIFYIDAITSMLAGVFLLSFKINVRKNIKPRLRDHKPLINKWAVGDKHFLYFLAALIPGLIVIFQHTSAMPVFLTRDLVFSTSTVGMLFAVNTVLIIFVEVPLNSAMSDWSYRNSLVLGMLFLASGFGMMAFVGNITLIILSIIIWTFGEMIVFPSSSAYISEIAPVEKRGEYMGFFQMIFSLGFTVGPWLGTKILEVYGAKLLWSGTFILGLVSAVMMLNVKSPLRYISKKSVLSEDTEFE